MFYFCYAVVICDTDIVRLQLMHMQHWLKRSMDIIWNRYWFSARRNNSLFMCESAY